MTFSPTVKAAVLARQVEVADYIPVGASATAQILGTTGGAAKGNLLKRLVITPSTTGAGLVTLIDGTGGSAVTIPIFISGTLADLTPVIIELNIVSQVGAWYLTTGGNVTVLAVGIFT